MEIESEPSLARRNRTSAIVCCDECGERRRAEAMEVSMRMGVSESSARPNVAQPSRQEE